MLSVFWAPDKKHHVSWDGTGEGPYVLERAEALGGPWETLYQGAALQFLTAAPKDPSVYQRWLYRLTDSTNAVFGPATLQVDPDRVSQYVIWHADRQVKRSGIETYLVTERQEGSNCVSCWDPILERRTQGACDACGGSGKTGGWPEPIPLWMSYGIEEPQPMPIQGDKSVQMAQLEAWTSAFPLVKTGDYIVRPLDRRVFDVMRWQPTRKGPFLLRQTLTLRLLPQSTLVDELSSLVFYDSGTLLNQTGLGSPTGFLRHTVRDLVREEVSSIPLETPTSGVIEGGTID